MPAGTKLGHDHLAVADVDDVLRLYHDLVGFDVMGRGGAKRRTGMDYRQLGLGR